MKKFTLLVGTLLSSHAFALDYCQPSSDDQQIHICAYSPNQRYAISAPVGFPVNIKIGDTEEIKRYDFAYSGIDKDGTPSKTWSGPGSAEKTTTKGRYATNMPIWAFQKGHSSLIVITQDSNGREKPYQFDLTATDVGEINNLTTSGIVFTYQAEIDDAAKKEAADRKKSAAADWLAKRSKEREAQGIARLKTDVFYGARNWAYQAQADIKYKNLAPSEVSDNGWLTEFQWPGNIQPPVITIVDEATNEPQLVPVSQQGDMYIAHMTAKRFRLFAGTTPVMDIINKDWKPTRPDPKTGTTSPDVIRTVIYKD